MSTESSYTAAIRRHQARQAAARQATQQAARPAAAPAAPADPTLLRWARGLAGATVSVQPSAFATRLVLCSRPAAKVGAAPAIVEGPAGREAFTLRCLELQRDKAEILGAYDRQTRQPQTLVIRGGEVTMTAQPAIPTVMAATLTPAQMLRKVTAEAQARAKAGGSKDAGHGRGGAGGKRR